MATWSALEYKTFLDPRTRPSHDLALQIRTSPRRIVDLGCGPGNSTSVCAARWPAASIIGVDNSPEMIEAARASNPGMQWVLGDIANWVNRPEELDARPDLIFSCAALQWVDNHAEVFPRLLGKVEPRGILAVHMPDYDAIPNRLMREMAAERRWREWFPDGRAKEWRSHTLEFYYDTLASCAKWIDLWATDYLWIMPNLNGIVEWYKSTGLRPYLDRIKDASQRAAFLGQYTDRLAPFFPEAAAGGVPFQFRRIFVVAGS